MNIAITGSEGFIAKNLINRLNDSKKYNIFLISKKTKESEFIKKISDANFIFHLAGINRPKNKKEFKENYLLTDKIANIILKSKKKIPIIFSSTTQVFSKNAYGGSKLKSEKILKNLKKKNKNSLCILRLPNVFGKWSRPNYNSVVATFCNNIINNKKSIIQKTNTLNLVHIDDVINIFLSYLKKKSWKNNYQKPQNVTKIKVRNLYNIIENFYVLEKTNYIPHFQNDFEKKLHSVFISFKSTKQIKSKSIKSHENKTGKFVEFLKHQDFGQISYLKCKPGQIRGMHYHHMKVENFLIIQGKAEFTYKNLSNNFIKKFKSNEKENKIIQTLPGWAHKIKNIGKVDLILLIWSNEVFNKKKPDTFKYSNL